MKRENIIKRLNARITRFIRHYLSLPKSKGKKVIVMIDGEQYHGGLTDRFRHIMSIYAYCKAYSLTFKLYYAYPCNLEKILLPNTYDWRISKEELSYSFIDSKNLSVYSHYKSTHTSKEKEIKRHLGILAPILSDKRKNFQYHIYGNCYFAENQFSVLFNELFKPSSLLQAKLDAISKNNMQYEAIVLRFQQLLGDFVEGDFPILATDNRNQLINKCIDKIHKLYENGYFSTQTILVTSDSGSFLEHVKNELSFVFIIPGKNIHMDLATKEDDNVYAKSFVDLLMLAKAKKITRLKASMMYDTGFPEFAAKIGNIEYRELDF